MIEINLLPESMRKPESTPLPLFLGLCLLLTAVLSLGAVLGHNALIWIPREEAQTREMEQKANDLEAQGTRLDELDAKIALIREHVDAVRQLFRERVIMAKLLWDVKRIITYEEELNKANPERRYVWLNTLSLAAGQGISLGGQCTATTEHKALAMVQELYTRFLHYQATRPPEESERKQLGEQVTAMKVEWAKRRAKNPGLPEESPELAGLQERLKLLQAAPPSGRIAVRAFNDFFMPGGIMLETTAWSAGGAAPGQVGNPTMLPVGAYRFTMRLQIKPPGFGETEGGQP